jgi:hypothetical protein
VSTIGNEIAEARKALAPEQAAVVIYRAIFETGPQRLSDSNKFIVIGTIAGGLIEWKKQLLAAQEGEAERWKKKYLDTKSELDDVRLKLAILQKEK